MLRNTADPRPPHVLIFDGARARLRAGVLGALASASGPVGFAMLVDIVPFEMREVGFPVLAAIGAFGPLVAFGLAYWFLAMRMGTYTLFWAVALGVNGAVFWFTLCLLPETMPVAPRHRPRGHLDAPYSISLGITHTK